MSYTEYAGKRGSTDRWTGGTEGSQVSNRHCTGCSIMRQAQARLCNGGCSLDIHYSLLGGVGMPFRSFQVKLVRALTQHVHTLLLLAADSSDCSIVSAVIWPSLKIPASTMTAVAFYRHSSANHKALLSSGQASHQPRWVLA